MALAAAMFFPQSILGQDEEVYGGSAANMPQITVWKIIPDGKKQYIAQAQSRFKVRVLSGASTESARMGDEIRCALVGDVVGPAGLLLASTGDVVSGTVTAVDTPRSELHSEFSKHHWGNSAGGIGISLSKIILKNGRELAIDGGPLPSSAVERVDKSALPMEVDKTGDVTIKGGGAKSKSFNLAVDGASIATGPIGGVILSSVAGFVKPSYALTQQSAHDTSHPRIKGFLAGAVEGLPGVGLAHSAIAHGAQVELSSGDEFMAVLKTDSVWNLN